MALAFILARLLLRGCRPSVPRSLPPVLCGGEAGPGFTRACSPRHITAYDLATGPWAMFPFVLLPSAAFPWDVTVGGSGMSPHFELLSVLFPENIGLHFF